MSVTRVSVGTVAVSTGAITPPLPASILTNDILILPIQTNNQAITIATPNGGTWTQFTNSPQGTGTAGSSGSTALTVFWSRYNGTQTAPVTSDSGDHQLARMIAYRGCINTGDPTNVTSGGVDTVSNTTGTITGATTTAAACMILAIIAPGLPRSTGTANFSGWANANLASITEESDNTTNNGNGGGLGMADGIKTLAGATGNTTVTLASAAIKAFMTIALTPQPPAPASERRTLSGIGTRIGSRQIVGF
jgi:hypothetical protein